MINYIKRLGRAFYNIFFDLSIDISGYIAYMAFLSFFPFLIMLFWVASYVGSTDAAQYTIQEFYKIIPPEVVSVIKPIVLEVTEQPPQGIFTIALIGILWVSSSGIEALRLGLNLAYGIIEKRSFLWRRVQSLFFVIIGSLSFLIGATLLIILPSLVETWEKVKGFLVELDIAEYLEFVPTALEWLHIDTILFRLLTAGSVVLIGIMTIYKWLPHHKVKFRDYFSGALAATFFWVCLATLFSLYIQKLARYDLLYGSLGGIIVTLIFFHLSALLVLYGAHVNKLKETYVNRIRGGIAP